MSPNEVETIHLLVLGLCTAIAIVVVGAMIWSIFSHRKLSRAGGARFHPHAGVEVLWSLVPIAILVAVAAPAIEPLLRAEDASDSDLDVKIIGYQWKWEYEYLGSGFRFSSQPVALSAGSGAGLVQTGFEFADAEVDRPLVVPVGAKVRLLLTSNDVIHSWWVPALGRNRNAIPGHLTEFWFRAEAPGTYRGRCAAWCGPDQPCMPVVVKAVPPEEFTAWLADNGVAPEMRHAGVAAEAAGTPAWDLDTAITQGQALHAGNCAACHQASGKGLPAAGFPPLAGTRVSKEEHIRVATHGRSGTAMTAFGSRLGDQELAAIVTYQRNAWGNDTGDLVAPAEIAAARGTGGRDGRPVNY